MQQLLRRLLKRLAYWTALSAARAGIAYVPRGLQVFVIMSVMEDLETGFACLGKAQYHVLDDISHQISAIVTGVPVHMINGVV